MQPQIEYDLILICTSFVPMSARNGKYGHVVDAAELRRRLYGSTLVRGWASLRGPAGQGLATQVDVHRWTVDLSMGCPTPFRRAYLGREDLLRAEPGTPLFVDHVLPCRRKICEHCMTLRNRQWTARAAAEFRANVRTWMLTFTLSPGEHALLDARCYSRNPAPTPDELLKLRCSEFAKLISQWFAGLHKGSRRDHTSYLAVAEVHDSDRTSPLMRGRPHYHMLLHERFSGALIPDIDCEFATESDAAGEPRTVYRVKDDSPARQLWPFGFTKIILCFDEKSAVYVCKYLTKNSSVGRVKASPHYGCSREAVEETRYGSDLPEPEGPSLASDGGVSSPRGMSAVVPARSGVEGPLSPSTYENSTPLNTPPQGRVFTD